MNHKYKKNQRVNAIWLYGKKIYNKLTTNILQTTN